MANVNHNTLSDPYLHEPKGVATALAGQVYLADGAASGDWVYDHRQVGGYISFSTGAPYTHAATTSDSVLNPTLTLVGNSGFTGLTSPNTRIRYDGTTSIVASLTASFSIQQTSGSGKDVELVFYKNGSELTGSRMITSSTTAEWHNITIAFNTTLATNDYIEVFSKISSAATVSYAAGYIRILGVPA